MEKFFKNYEIKSFECDQTGFLRLRTLFNFFQDLADTHANKMGLGYHFCKERGIGWIGGAYHIRIHKMPKWEDQIQIWTWPSASTAVTGIREFQMCSQDNFVLIDASSQWVLIDTQKFRPISVIKHVGAYDLIPERFIETQFEKLPILERIDYETDEIIRYDDIDINGHVNNAVYPTWALDALPPIFLKKNNLLELKIQFKKPALLSNSVHVQTQIESEHTFHVITNKDGSSEFARLEINWRSKDVSL